MHYTSSQYKFYWTRINSLIQTTFYLPPFTKICDLRILRYCNDLWLNKWMTLNIHKTKKYFLFFVKLKKSLKNKVNYNVTIVVVATIEEKIKHQHWCSSNYNSHIQSPQAWTTFTSSQITITISHIQKYSWE